MKYQNASWAKNISKIALYNTYSFLLEDEGKALSSLTREKMYEGILDLFHQIPWVFYGSLSEETRQFLRDLQAKKTAPLAPDDPRVFQDDFQLLYRLLVLNERGEFNDDFTPLLQSMDHENPQAVEAALAEIAYLKGLLDIYGYIEREKLLELLASGPLGALDKKQFSFFLSFPLVNYFYRVGSKQIYRFEISEQLNAFLKKRQLNIDLDYRVYSGAEVLSYANRFYFPKWKKNAQIIQKERKDLSRLLSEHEDPFGIYYDGEYHDKPQDEDYSLVNENTPKWYLKGHSLGELAALKLQEDHRIVLIEERDIGPEIFFPFKDTIVGVYNLAKETLHLKGDVATGDMPWDDLEKIKKEFYAHRESYLQSYIASLQRPLTPYELDTVKGLREAIPSSFIFHSLSKDGAVMIDTKDGKRYLVHPLGMGFSEMLQGGVYDELVSTVIVPFEDYLTYDSFISSQKVFVSFSEDLHLDEGKLIRSDKDFANLA